MPCLDHLSQWLGWSTFTQVVQTRGTWWPGAVRGPGLRAACAPLLPGPHRWRREGAAPSVDGVPDTAHGAPPNVEA